MAEDLSPLVDWLLSGDVSIRYQATRDLLGKDDRDLQNCISQDGWGKRFLDCRNPDGTWGERFYQPKWISTHYTLLDLKHLQIAPNTAGILDVILRVVDENIAKDGGIGCSRGNGKSDVCVNGMFLNYACYFGIPETAVISVIDFLLAEHMADGGFNCMSNRSGANHSSLHSTISVLEGILSHQRAGYSYRRDELAQAATSSQEFMLQHRLYKSDHTGQVINQNFLKMPVAPRWWYNVLRALDYFCEAAASYDERMADALAAISARRRIDGMWPHHAAHPGAVHFVMEPPRKPSRWNTLRALRILGAYAAVPTENQASQSIVRGSSGLRASLFPVNLAQSNAEQALLLGEPVAVGQPALCEFGTWYSRSGSDVLHGPKS